MSAKPKAFSKLF